MISKDKFTIALVDDNKEILDAYQSLLSTEFNVVSFDCANYFLSKATNLELDLVVLDIHMPEKDGYQTYQELKRELPRTPVIFLSGDPSEDSIVKCLELGADDVLNKPVSKKEFVARIHNKIKSAKAPVPQEEKAHYDDLELDFNTHTASLKGEKLPLTPIEYKILFTLTKNSGTIVSRESLAQTIWQNIHVQNQNIDTHLSNLRKKLGEYGERISTIKARGYKFS